MLSDKSVPETAGNVKQSEIQKSGAQNQDRLDVQAVIPRSGFGFRDGLRRQRYPGFLYALHQLVQRLADLLGLMAGGDAEAQTRLAAGNGGEYGRGHEHALFAHHVAEPEGVLVPADHDRDNGRAAGQADVEPARLGFFDEAGDSGRALRAVPAGDR